MMPIHRLLLLLLVSGVVPAGQAADGPPAGERDPSEMTVEERMTIMQRMNDYHGCVYKEAMARVENTPDIRQAADQGMAACRAALDTLQGTIDGFGFEPAFGEQFVHHAQSRAVKMLMPELSMRKGGQ